ncbi:MAG: hypothetical protein AAGE52_08150 [Myxococcota bacterium]
MTKRSTKLRSQPMPEIPPLKHYARDDGRIEFSVENWPGAVTKVFEDLQLQGGGCTWEGLLHAFADLASPPITEDYVIDAEASDVWITVNSVETAERFKVLIRRAIADLEFLRHALAHAEAHHDLE